MYAALPIQASPTGVVKVIPRWERSADGVCPTSCPTQQLCRSQKTVNLDHRMAYQCPLAPSVEKVSSRRGRMAALRANCMTGGPGGRVLSRRRPPVFPHRRSMKGDDWEAYVLGCRPWTAYMVTVWAEAVSAVLPAVHLPPLIITRPEARVQPAVYPARRAAPPTNRPWFLRGRDSRRTELHPAQTGRR